MFKNLLRPTMHVEGVYLRSKTPATAPAPGLFPSRRWVHYAMPADLRKEPGTSLLPDYQRKSDPLYRH
jgi:hypothetical protein